MITGKNVITPDQVLVSNPLSPISRASHITIKVVEIFTVVKNNIAA